jgi:hypothetical protein
MFHFNLVLYRLSPDLRLVGRQFEFSTALIRLRWRLALASEVPFDLTPPGVLTLTLPDGSFVSVTGIILLCPIST